MMQYKLEEYVVAFIDILGSSKKIKADGENSLNIVHQVYENALVSCEELYNNEIIHNLKPVVKIYSDNIVVAVPTKDNGIIAAFVSVAIISGLIQQEFLKYKYLVRGGISMGDFFADDTMLWGKALLDAYYIESNVSIYPRIVIHPETVSKLKLAIDPKHHKWIKQDMDGLFFVDYLQETAYKANYIELLLCRIKECESLFLEVIGDIKSEQKIQWHNTYLYSKLDVYAPDYENALSQEISKLEVKTAEIEKRNCIV